MIVLDASALIAFAKPSDAHHGAAVDAIAEATDALGAHPITVAEFLVHPARLGQGEPAYTKLTERLGLHVLDAPGRRWPVHLASTRASSGLRMPDAVVLACATAVGGTVLTFGDRLTHAARTAGALHEVG
jgi:predicted nucleic acid-binding protein